MFQSRSGSASVPVGGGKAKATRKRRSLATACAVGVLALVAAFTAPLAAAARPQPYTATYTGISFTVTGEQTVGTYTRIEFDGTQAYTLTSEGTTYTGTMVTTAQVLVNSNGTGPIEATDVLTGGSPCGSGTFTEHDQGIENSFLADGGANAYSSGFIASVPSATNTVRIHYLATWNSPPGPYLYVTGVLSCN